MTADATDERVLGLRERKKRRTRRALVEAALRLFGEKGYDRTTVADIAAAADVSPRTFFGYFRSKEEVLFAETDERIGLIEEALAQVGDEAPLDAIRRLVDHIFEQAGTDLAAPANSARMAIVITRPELQGRALQRLFAAEQILAERLRAAHPDKLDEALARAMGGALIGALVGAAVVGFERGHPPRRIRKDMLRAVDLLGGGLDDL